MSRVNPTIPLDVALGWYESALKDLSDDYVPAGFTADGMRTKVSHTVQNILRDCC